MVFDKSVSSEYLSKIISALSMFSSSFLHASLTMVFSKHLFEAVSHKETVTIPDIRDKKPLRYFKPMNYIYFLRYACLAIFVFLLLVIIFYLPVLSPKTRLRQYGSK
ncbi:hypothetical protein THOM_0615 [Trachipleistophora hominis]|uniref:Uncharacterized protein n=1 Tax=Trachipleistophora hominis TaxID=72359 RepID=L7K029_TRAHO|nr:hypothetical protein THOM_0615 [Trachipleistophora hominis]